MGYRSDVTISITKEGYSRLVSMCDEAKVEHPLMSRDVLPDFVTLFEGCVVFGWDDIKWYEDFPEVKAVSEAVSALDEEGVPLRFVRVGEDPEDVDELGDADGLAAYPVAYRQRTEIELVYN